MAEIQDTQPQNNPPNGEITSQEPLGFKNPLLPANPLGQNFISRKFLYPLGARAITAFDPSVFFSREMPDEVPPDNPFDNSPFFAESQGSELSKSVAASDGITSAAPPVVAQLKESTLIQPRLETDKPASRAEVIKPGTAPQVTYKINQGKEEDVGLLSSTTTLSEMPPVTITDATQIQPRLESKISTDNSEVVQLITAPQIASITQEKQELYPATTPPVTITDATQIQPFKESKTQPDNPEAIESVTAPQLIEKKAQEKEEFATLHSSTKLSETPEVTITDATVQRRLESRISADHTEKIESVTAPQVNSIITQEKEAFAATETPEVTITNATVQPRLESKISTEDTEVIQSIAAPQVASITPEKQEFNPATTPLVTITDATQIQPRLETQTPYTTETFESGITRQAPLATPEAAEEITESQLEFAALASVTKSEETPEVTNTDATQIQPRLESKISTDNPEVIQSITAPQVASITQEKQEFDTGITPEVTITDATLQPRLEKQTQVIKTEELELVAAPQVAEEVTQEKVKFVPRITPQVTITDATQIQPRLESKISTDNPEVIQSITAPKVASITQEKQEFAPRITPEVTITEATLQAFKESKTQPDSTEVIESVTAPQVASITQEKQEFDTGTTPQVTITDATLQSRLEKQTQVIKTEGLESVAAPQVAEEVTQEKVKFAPKITPQVTITNARLQPRLESKISTDNTEKIESVAAPQVVDEVTQKKEDFAPRITPEVTITDATQVQTFKETETPTTKAEGIESVAALQVADKVSHTKEAFATTITPEVTTTDPTIQARLEKETQVITTGGIESVAAPQVTDEVNHTKEDFAPTITPEVTTTDATIQPQLAQLESKISADSTEGIESVTAPQVADKVSHTKEDFATTITPEVTNTDPTIQARLEKGTQVITTGGIESVAAPHVVDEVTQEKEDFAPTITPEVTITDKTVQPRLESKISADKTEGIESVTAPQVNSLITQEKEAFAPATTPEATITDATKVQAFKEAETPTTKTEGIEPGTSLQVADEVTQEKEEFAPTITPEVTITDKTVQPRLESKIPTTKTEKIEPVTSPQAAFKVNEAQSEFAALASVTTSEETPQVTTTNSIQVQPQLETQTPATAEGIEQKTTPDAAPLPPQPAAEQTSEVAVLSNVTEPMAFSVGRKVESLEMPAIASEKTLTQSDITAPSLASSVTTPDVPLVQLLSEQEPRKATEEAVPEINAPSSIAPIPIQLFETVYAFSNPIMIKGKVNRIAKSKMV